MLFFSFYLTLFLIKNGNLLEKNSYIIFLLTWNTYSIYFFLSNNPQRDFFSSLNKREKNVIRQLKLHKLKIQLFIIYYLLF